ncbi:XRE family transcriptional regulator [Azotobacter salinestris]
MPGTDADKAARLGITRPRYSDLKHGRIQKFSIDALVSFASAVGLHVHLELAA